MAEPARLSNVVEAPCASLMQLWENCHPVGGLIASGQTESAQMVDAGMASTDSINETSTRAYVRRG
jgi:hypothetical protein